MGMGQKLYFLVPLLHKWGIDSKIINVIKLYRAILIIREVLCEAIQRQNEKL